MLPDVSVTVSKTIAESSVVLAKHIESTTTLGAVLYEIAIRLLGGQDYARSELAARCAELAREAHAAVA
jgi:hypothetical protein